MRAVTLLLLSLLLSSSNSLAADDTAQEPAWLRDDRARGTLVTDGSFVHNVGELQLHITNWGLIGSAPGSNSSFSDAPSAMWPAGSGVEYLFAAGLWVGAVKAGVPLVSTGVASGPNTVEFLPNPDDPLDTIWEMTQGEPNGLRLPDPGRDDDDDGLVDEDPKNGLDDDGDGLIDEDFGAIGNQHFRCTMRDNSALATESNPEHQPLNIRVVQESFQWENDSVDDFVGFHYSVKNIGVNTLQDVFIGFWADSDVGPRTDSNRHQDDLPYFFEGGVVAADGSIVPISIAGIYDDDGDQGQSPGFFGIMFLDHPTDPTGFSAPPQVGIRSFQAFSSNQPFDKGGDPRNDAERYELLSREEKDSIPELYSTGKANDFRILLATGPFGDIEPGETLSFRMAMVVGAGPGGLMRNAAEAALTFYGTHLDLDSDPDTGIKGRETLLCENDFGSPGPGNPIFLLIPDCADSADIAEGNFTPVTEDDLIEFTGSEFYTCGAARRGLWFDNDCEFQAGRRPDAVFKCSEESPSLDEKWFAGCTGIRGRETNVPWLVGTAPPSPRMRLKRFGGRVHLFWDNLSELVPDVRSQQIDFESYRIWRADGWDRPYGSSIENGPDSRLWSLLAEYDVVDWFEERRVVRGQEIVRQLPLGANTGLDEIRYTPMVLRPQSREFERFAGLRALISHILGENPWLVPQLDPASIMRYRDFDGSVTELGQRYPELADWECCEAQIDTLYWGGLGVQWYEYVDTAVHNGIYYFYSVTATDFEADNSNGGHVATGPGLVGDPQGNFQFAIPEPLSQSAEERATNGQNIYVVPNPATRAALADFSQLRPNSDDPTGVRVMIANLPRSLNTIKIFTLSGDLIQTIEHDGRGGSGAAFWNLISRNGQEIVSGIYLYSVESSDPNFDRVVGRFVVVR